MLRRRETQIQCITLLFALCLGCDRRLTPAEQGTIIAELQQIDSDLTVLASEAPEKLRKRIRNAVPFPYASIKPDIEEARRISRFYPRRSGKPGPATLDGWEQPYMISLFWKKHTSDQLAPNAEMLIWSFGPNKRNDNGLGDDVYLKGNLIIEGPNRLPNRGEAESP
jgi:hypothetical protein